MSKRRNGTKKQVTKTLALFLSLILCVTSVNVSVFAEESRSVVTEIITETATETTEETTVEVSSVELESEATVEEEMGEQSSETPSVTESSEASETTDANTHTKSIYEGNNFKVIFSLTSQWEEGYNADVTIENTSESAIENWCIAFSMDDEITNIWNAVIDSHEDNTYIIKNAGWNADIAVGSSVSFGISSNEAFGGFPKEYTLLGRSEENDAQNYSVQYYLDSDWGSGFSGRIVLTNNTDSALEDWTLEFDFDREITSIWDAVVESHEGNHYVIKNAGYNSNIAARQTISFGFNGVDGSAGDVPTQFELYSYEIEEKEIDVTLDSENDGVPDYMEDYLGTDKHLEDTDEDGLSDFIELYSFTLNPLLKDTDGNGVMDGDEDSDGDGLTNRREVSLGSSILHIDTDEDGLNDGEEVLTYGTDPVLWDTDGDGASDKSEVELGTDPLMADTSFDAVATADAEDSVDVSVEVTLAGNQVDSLKVERFEHEFLFPEEMPGYVGGAYDFSVDGTFDKATLKFTFDESLLADETFDPVIYYFNEEKQLLEELSTTITGNVATAEVTHFSKYILLNRKVYQDAFEWQDVWSTTEYTGVEVVLLIDDSYSMTWNDSSYQRLSVARNLIDKLPENSKVGIIKFTGVVTALTPTLTADKEYAKSFLTPYYFYIDYSTSMYTALKRGFSLFESTDDSVAKMMVVISDGEAQDSNQHSSVITTANDMHVKIYTVGLGSDTSYFTEYLEPLANNTAGAFYSASDAGQLETVFNDINKKIDMETDTDGDGITDFYEENMVMFNGVKLKLEKDNPDSDGDGISDGEEVAEFNYQYNEDKTQVIVTGRLIANPLEIDSDGDTYNDYEDRYPLVVAVNSDMFQRAEDYNMDLPYIGSDYEANYGTGTYEWEELNEIYLDAWSYGKSYSKIAPAAASALNHYLDNTGTDFEIDVDVLLKESLTGKILYMQNVDKLKNHAKSVLKDGDSLYIVTKKMDAHVYDINLNWSLFLGVCSGGIVAIAKRDGEDISIKFRYIVYDYYDWEEDMDAAAYGGLPKDCDMYKLHHAGWAR